MCNIMCKLAIIEYFCKINFFILKFYYLSKTILRVFGFTRLLLLTETLEI